VQKFKSDDEMSNKVNRNAEMVASSAQIDKSKHTKQKHGSTDTYLPDLEPTNRSNRTNDVPPQTIAYTLLSSVPNQIRTQREQTQIDRHNQWESPRKPPAGPEGGRGRIDPRAIGRIWGETALAAQGKQSADGRFGGGGGGWG
jgi:hypothetical protein